MTLKELSDQEQAEAERARRMALICARLDKWAEPEERAQSQERLINWLLIATGIFAGIVTVVTLGALLVKVLQ